MGAVDSPAVLEAMLGIISAVVNMVEAGSLESIKSNSGALVEGGATLVAEK